MVDLNNILLNSLANPDTAKGVVDNPEIEQALNKDDLSTEGSDDLTPQSFVLLMAQILTVSSTDMNSPELDKLSKNAAETTALSNEILKTNTGLDTNTLIKSGQPLEQSNPQGVQLDNELPNDTLVQSKISKNIALTWIDSGEFAPPGGAAPDLSAEIEQLVDDELPTKEKINAEKLASNDPRIKSDSTNQIKNTDILFDMFKMNTNKSVVSGVSESIDAALINKSALSDPKANSIATNNTGYFPSNVETPFAQNATQHKSLEVPLSLNHSQWAEKFSEQIVWLGHQTVKSAFIKIHPEDLGPIEINIKVVKDAASVNISTHNNHVRDVVDQALPRLKEMMAEQGINLSDVHIQSDANSRQHSQQNNDSTMGQSQDSDQEVQGTTPIKRRPPKGLIDYFA